jgi:membrane fusion protein, macrolide-specific efflux system
VKLRLFVIVLLLVVGGGAAFVALGGLPAPSGAAASEYLTSTAAVGDVSQEVAATGTIAATETWALGFGALPQPVTDSTTAVGSGTWTVRKVSVKVGDAVRKGALLATASTSDLDEQLKVAKSSLTSAKLQEKLAKATYDDASGTTAIRQAHIQYISALNGRRQAQTTVDGLRTQLARAKLVAPIDGVVTAVNVTAGLENTGTAITLAASSYEVTADVVESDIGAMAVGQAATVTVDAIGATIQGTVAEIAPAASTSSGSSSVVSFPVTVTLTGGPAALRTGMTADVTIVSASATNVLTVPSAALRGTSGSYRVQVMGADGVPVAKDVTVGLVTQTTAEIKSGLTAGETVVTGTSSARTATSTTGGTGRNGFGGGNFPGGGGNVIVRQP